MEVNNDTIDYNSYYVNIIELIGKNVVLLESYNIFRANNYNTDIIIEITINNKSLKTIPLIDKFKEYHDMLIGKICEVGMYVRKPINHNVTKTEFKFKFEISKEDIKNV